MKLPALNLHLFRTPSSDLRAGTEFDYYGIRLRSVLVPHSQPSGSIVQRQMEHSFERACEMLEQLPRMHIEPDGSFVWTADGPWGDRAAREAWQVDGMLYDFGGRLARVELKGSCPRQAWLALVECFQPDGDLLVFLINAKYYIRQHELLRIWDE
ncbi:MAG: hypothetical protein KF752_18160 [Pirellulaceae bacterium]|nr:hypothetical protein [Pirellulaceae bacterium]